MCYYRTAFNLLSLMKKSDSCFAQSPRKFSWIICSSDERITKVFNGVFSVRNAAQDQQV